MTELQQRQKFFFHRTLRLIMGGLLIFLGLVILRSWFARPDEGPLEMVLVILLFFGLPAFGMFRFRTIVTAEGIFRRVLRTRPLVQWKRVVEVQKSAPDVLDFVLSTEKNVQIGHMGIDNWDEFVACVRSHIGAIPFTVLPDPDVEKFQQMLQMPERRFFIGLLLSLTVTVASLFYWKYYLITAVAAGAGAVGGGLGLFLRKKRVEGKFLNPLLVFLPFFILFIPFHSLILGPSPAQKSFLLLLGSSITYYGAAAMGTSAVGLVLKRRWAKEQKNLQSN